jgi:hypothetical protein
MITLMALVLVEDSVISMDRLDLLFSPVLTLLRREEESPSKVENLMDLSANILSLYPLSQSWEGMA